MFTVKDMQCEFAYNPLGIGTPRPRFNWLLEHAERGQSQTAYQILVASSLELLKTNQGNLWNSGKMRGDNVLVEYAGAPLVSRQRAYWKVRSWDVQDHESVYSDAAWFELGLLHPSDWWAEWIGFPGGHAGKALYFRHSFETYKAIRCARTYISGLGWYELRLNGSKIGTAVLNPAQTTYNQRVLYSTYDVAGRLIAGQNVVGVIVGSGWYGSPKLLLQIEISYQDGSTAQIVTGRMGQGGSWWRVSDGPIVECSIYDGEIYDARLEHEGWDSPGWSEDEAARFGAGACIVEPPGGQLVAQCLEPIQVTEMITPISRAEPKSGVYVFDVGQNLSGWAKLAVQGTSGTAVTLRFAEVLRDDGTVDQDNLRHALARDIYILSGKGMETWEPRFTYHGFRYIQVEGYPGIPELEAVRACVVRSAIASSGQFECDHPLVTRLHQAVWWTEATNLYGLPTDCPQRDERMGWLNDMAARSEEAIYNFEVARLFSKWIADIADVQDPETGAIPDTAPYRWGNRPGDPVNVCYLLIPWLLYRHYGDTRTMSDHFDGMRRWVDYLTHRAKPDHILEYSYYGDWAPPIGEAVIGSIGASAMSQLTPGPLVSTAHYYYSAHLLAKIAHILGRESETRQYADLADNIRVAFHERFWDPVTGGYGPNNQASNAIALYFGLVPENCREVTLNNLVRDVEIHDSHLTTGNLATKYLLESLAEGGYGDVALAIVTQTTYPSWGFMLENGATTIWERWETTTNSGMNSRNHPMYASVGAWLYRRLAGIQVGDNARGFSHIVIRPLILNDLRFVRAAIMTVRGRVEAAWRRVDQGLSLTVSIPVGCQAILVLPQPKPNIILRENGQVVDDAHNVSGIDKVWANNHTIAAVLGSGEYDFSLIEDLL